MANTIFTIGHSNQSLESFLKLLQSHDIDVLVDVRSSPYSKYANWFNKDPLRAALRGAGIKYLFMGDSLGGMPRDPEYYDSDSRVRYYAIAESDGFADSIERLVHGADEYRIAVMCGEENPTECHRNLLVGRVLADNGIDVWHIRAKGPDQLWQPAETELFTADGEPGWKSTRSVSRRSQPRSSSDS